MSPSKSARWENRQNVERPKAVKRESGKTPAENFCVHYVPKFWQRRLASGITPSLACRFGGTQPEDISASSLPLAAAKFSKIFRTVFPDFPLYQVDGQVFQP